MSAGRCLSKLLLEQSPVCSWLASRDGLFEEIYGDPMPLFNKTASDLKGRPLVKALGRDAAANWLDRYARAFEGGSLTARERRGETHWNISVFPVRSGGETQWAGVIAREVTIWSRAEQELRNTVLGALKAMEFERTMASRFLHDSVGQNLTALGLQLDLVRMDMEGHTEICDRIGEIQKVLETMMEQVRDYSYELNPSTVERAGLRAALDRLAVRVRDRFHGTLRVNVDPSLKIDPRIASALYQIAQESVENAVQHASCSTIEIAVKSTRTGPYLEVRDNGKGFDPGDPLGGSRGLGLLSMEHYAAQAGLALKISSHRSKGTTVRAALTDTV